MGKLADSSLGLRCVNCHNTETPLWRAGPDGPKTLCNACGVRFKKGKLALYRNKDGSITAVKSEHAFPVHIPPSNRKISKKIVLPTVSAPPLPNDGIASKRAIRKNSAETAHLSSLLKPRQRSRRVNAGQLPGRYAAKTLPDALAHDASPSPSPTSSPTHSPHHDGLFSIPASMNVDEPSLYQFTNTDEENIAPEVACLGIGTSGDSDSMTLLPMPADPSSTEEFSSAFAELGRDSSLTLDFPDRIDALRGLVLDPSRRISRHYKVAVQALCNLCRLRYDSPQASLSKVVNIDDCKNFIRSFAHDQTNGVELNDAGNKSGVMLSEKTLYSSAAEALRCLMDSSEIMGLAETCMVEILAEDVSGALSNLGLSGFESLDVSFAYESITIQP